MRVMHLGVNKRVEDFAKKHNAGIRPDTIVAIVYMISASGRGYSFNRL
jgi:hypothetical protein